MPFNGSGVFSAPGANFPVVTGTTIDSADNNAVINDIASGLTNCITKDGQTTVTANIPMATYKHTGVGNATALTEYVSADQVVDGALTYGGASAAGSDAYAVNLAISPGAYAAGQRYQFLTDVGNTGACTVNFSSIGAGTIVLADGSTPYNGAIQINSVADVVYDGTNFILLNPFIDLVTLLPVAGAATITGALNVGGDTALGSTTITSDNECHVYRGTGAGAGAASNGDALATIENNGDAYLQFLTPSANTGGLLVGDESSNNSGRFLYSNNTNSWDLRTSALTRFTFTLGMYADGLSDQGAGTGNFTGVYENGVQLPRAYSTTYTTGSISFGTQSSFNITHGLGTDDVYLVLMAENNTSAGDWVATVTRADAKQIVCLGTGGTINLVAGNTPSSGDINVTIENRNAATSTIDVSVMVYALG